MGNWKRNILVAMATSQSSFEKLSFYQKTRPLHI